MRGWLLSVVGLCLVLPVGAQEAAPTQDAPLISAGVMSARLTKRVQPVFPKEAIEQKIEGTVTLRITVSETGSVEYLTFLNGPEVFRDAAMDAVRQWHYKPFEKDGRPVAVKTMVRVNFWVEGAGRQIHGHAGNFGSEMPPGVAIPKEPVKISGSVMATVITQRVMPTYPKEAHHGGVDGPVTLHLIVARDGTVKSVDVVEGPEILRAASVDAVRQWRFRPYLINGQPVEVDTNVTVNFR